MAGLTLKIRRMETGETMLAEFDTIEDAQVWLSERPVFVEVVRVVTPMTPEAEASLRSAMRALDEQELALRSEQDHAQEAARRTELARLQAEAEAESQADRDDDGGEMEIHWSRTEGMSNGDEDDPREITEAARRAVLHWLRERDSWVHARRQHVAEARIRVWPASVPTGNESDRVIEGEFAAWPGLSDVEIDG